MVNARIIDETSMKVQRLEVQNDKELLTLLRQPQIKEILLKWNGKKVNKRIVTDLQKVIPIINGSYSQYSPKLEFYTYTEHGKRFVTGTPDRNGCSLATYVKNDKNWIFDVSTEQPINAGELIEKLESRISYIERNMQKQEENLNRIDEINAEYVRLQEEVNKFHESLHYSVKEIFGFKII